MNVITFKRSTALYLHDKMVTNVYLKKYAIHTGRIRPNNEHPKQEKIRIAEKNNFAIGPNCLVDFTIVVTYCSNLPSHFIVRKIRRIRVDRNIRSILPDFAKLLAFEPPASFDSNCMIKSTNEIITIYGF